MADDMARSLAERTIQHFTSQLAAVNQAIAEIIDNDPLEFGVRALNVEHIIVLGHAHCGGVRALLEGALGDAGALIISSFRDSTRRTAREARRVAHRVEHASLEGAFSQ